MKKESVSEKKEMGEGLGISGLTLGVVSIVYMGIYGLALSIVGLIFSLIQQKNKETKIGKAGVILNIVSLVLNLILIIVYYTILLPKLSQMGISL